MDGGNLLVGEKKVGRVMPLALLWCFQTWARGALAWQENIIGALGSREAQDPVLGD